MAPLRRTPLSKESREAALAARRAETLAHNKRMAAQLGRSNTPFLPFLVPPAGVRLKLFTMVPLMYFCGNVCYAHIHVYYMVRVRTYMYR